MLDLAVGLHGQLADVVDELPRHVCDDFAPRRWLWRLCIATPPHGVVQPLQPRMLLVDGLALVGVLGLLPLGGGPPLSLVERTPKVHSTEER